MEGLTFQELQDVKAKYRGYGLLSAVKDKNGVIQVLLKGRKGYIPCTSIAKRKQFRKVHLVNT